ncbi:MAG TPA: hypothetical protein VLB44_21165 [Kofleriaceae bacterium]|nr:hypothetical protein [Kofleriaceae bacterium]
MRSLILVAVVCGAAHAQPMEAPPDAGPIDAPPSTDATPPADAVPVDAPPAPAPPPVDAAVPAEQPAPAPPAPAVVPPPSRNKDAAWLFVGGALAFATTGVVLAYASSSSESDLEDLYVSLDGKPPVFDAKTRARYDDLVAEGQRYEHLSWASFGVAGGMAIGAAIMFWRGAHEVAPVITPNSAGVALRF